jgi:hypothetical protein
MREQPPHTPELAARGAVLGAAALSKSSLGGAQNNHRHHNRTA